MLENAKFITTEFKAHFGSHFSPWSVRRPRLYQHTDLIASEGLPMFVRDFSLASADGAKLVFSALGAVVFYINGKKINQYEMEPGWTDYKKRSLACEYDISGFVKTGENRILAVVSGGWYSGRISGGYYGDTAPAVIAEITSGGRTVCATDESWSACVGGPIRTADIWDGEYFDATEISYEEMSAVSYALDTEKWKKSDILKGGPAEITPFVGSKIKRRDSMSLSPVKITVFDGTECNGSFFGKIRTVAENAALPVEVKCGQTLIVDFGQESVGRLAIELKGAKGTVVAMRYAEFLNDSGKLSRGNDGPEGDVYTVNLRSALGRANYVTGSSEKETYYPTHSFYGYRYVSIRPENDIVIYSLTAQVVGNDNAETGKIETSDPLVNKLISNALWGQRSNYFSVPTDCPQRDERLGWTGDAQAFSMTAAYNADVYGFFRKWMQDMRDSQSESGGYADVNPRVGCCSSEDACAWGDAGVIIPYNMYLMFGDKTLLEEHFDSMDKYMSGLVEKYGLSGPIPRYGDWLAYDWCDNKFISSAYFVHDADLMIYMSGVLGKNEKKAHYEKLRADAYGYFCDKFMKNGKPVEQTQCNKIITLAFGLADDKNAGELADELAAQIHENGDRLSCGFLGTYNLCPTLSRFGKDKTAYNLLMQRNEPSWLYSIDQGATTIWERWNSYTKENGFGDVGMNSFNHYAYGAVVEWMYRFMAGIGPMEPGFKKIILEPRIDFRTAEELPEGQKRMQWVKAEYNSRAGLIKSAWKITEDGYEYTCTVPEGADAVIKLPVIKENISADGVEYEIADGVLTAALTAGSYTFVM